MARSRSLSRGSLLNRRAFNALLLAAPGAIAQRSSSDPISRTLEQSLRKEGIPAATAIVGDADRVLYSFAFGIRDAGSRRPVTIDSIFGLASMTKAVTSVAAMQLVEQGKLTLDDPLNRIFPELAQQRVLTGFAAGTPVLRPATKPITLRMLLSHTSGFAYDTWNEAMSRYAHYVRPQAPAVYPSILWGTESQPVVCEPGTCWQYGTSADWAARLIEAVSGRNLSEYVQSRVFEPLEMHDTGYRLSPEQFDRLVAVNARQAGGSFEELPRNPPGPKSYWGGTGLYSTAGDYLRFSQMILRRGRGSNGAAILRPETVDMMSTNQIGALSAGKMRNYTGRIWQDVTFHPGYTDGFGLGFLINSIAYKNGRSAGSLAWAGGWNTFFWIDPARKLAAILMMQFQPFYDRAALRVLTAFERSVYRSLRA